MACARPSSIILLRSCNQLLAPRAILSQQNSGPSIALAASRRAVRFALFRVLLGVALALSPALLASPLSSQSAEDPVVPTDALGPRLMPNPPRGASAIARAHRIDTRPRIDGVLDEAFWAAIEPITDFVQRDPVDGGYPSERTEARLGVTVSGYFLERMKIRWGGCNPRSGNIRLNTELVKKPRDLREYVVVHEMLPLVEPTHSERFVVAPST